MVRTTIPRLLLSLILVLAVACSTADEPQATPIVDVDTVMSENVTYDDLLELYLDLLERIENHTHTNQWGQPDHDHTNNRGEPDHTHYEDDIRPRPW